MMSLTGNTAHIEGADIAPFRLTSDGRAVLQTDPIIFPGKECLNWTAQVWKGCASKQVFPCPTGQSLEAPRRKELSKYAKTDGNVRCVQELMHVAECFDIRVGQSRGLPLNLTSSVLVINNSMHR